MIYRRIALDPQDERVYMDAYVPDAPREAKPAMLVIPGGGYANLAEDREGEPIALAFVARGVCAFVLHYRVGGAEDVYPTQLLDASRAMVYIRACAEELSVDPARVYAVGFSAGGHLAGCLATMHDLPEIADELELYREENRPTAVILAYPVVSAMLPTHQASFVNLLGMPYEEMSVEARRYVSLETQVGPRTSPMFLWHTAEDTVVPPYGTLRLCETLLEQRIPVMMHLYPNGPHGMALANGVTRFGNPAYVDPLCERWIDDALAWFDRLYQKETSENE